MSIEQRPLRLPLVSLLGLLSLALCARGQEPDPERARQITFYNIPDTCSISIWSLDGDLVRRMEHRENPLESDASVHVWNLITRNTQAVKTGLYIWTVESRYGNEVGKLVIIK